MRRVRLLTVALAVAGGLACDPLQPSQPGWETDNPDGGNTDDDTQPDEETGEEDPIGPGARNNAPRASAGRDQINVAPETLVMLDGSGTTDIDGDPLTYTWTLLSKPAGSAATINNFTFDQAQLFVDRAGDYNCELRVSDGRLEHSDTVVIKVLNDNNPPRANAGIDQTVTIGATVQLSGGGSTDPDGDPLEYYWTLSTPPGSGATLSGASIASAAVSPSFPADAAGVFTASLEVYDGENRSAPDLVVINVRDNSSGGISSGGTSGSSGSSDCLDCGAYGDVASNAWTAGDLASGLGLLVLPVFVALWQRRRED